jgi:DNA polymerase-1
MIEAYKRELRLMPHVLKMEQRGINLDGPLLKVDTNYYWGKLDELEELICQKLGRQVDVDSGAQLADAIEAAGLSKGFATTPTGLRSTAKESLINAIADDELLGHLLVRGSIATCLRTFMQPWVVQYEAHGRLFMKWNQIRNYTDTGARTGRISSSPNLQNIPVEWEELKEQLEKISYPVPAGLLPQVRKYIIPDEGKIFIGRDYSAQEMKLLAHFTKGALLEALKRDPSKDIHQIAAGIAGITRKVAKTLGFAVLYGAGVGRVADTLGTTASEATRIKAKYLEALPEIKAFQKELNEIGKAHNYTETLGKRRYRSQKPAVVKGRFKSFEYKLPNYKIQGSAADQTKEAMIRYCETTQCGELVLTVHDQLVTQVPAYHAHVSLEREIFEKAVNGSFQDVLGYEVRSDESLAYNFAELKGTSDRIQNDLLRQQDVNHQNV